MKWNKQQLEIFEQIKNDEGPHLTIEARAGTGKTSTILGSLPHTNPDHRVLVCAFNKNIQLEIADKISKLPDVEGIDVRTLHSIGMGALRSVKRDFQVDRWRTSALVKELAPNLVKGLDYRHKQAATDDAARLCGLAKNSLAFEPEHIIRLAYRHGLGDDLITPEEMLAPWVAKVLAACKADISKIDFDDMIWLPCQFGAKPKGYDLIFVDEAQDLNPAQMWLVRKMLEPRSGRLVAVGDDRQAIYSWRGAGSGVLEKIVTEFEAEWMPLTTTYRCPKLVVKLAQEIVPDYRAAPNAPDGVIENCTLDAVIERARAGDFILSRTNAPLIGCCLALLRKGTPARVAGRDIGKGIRKLIVKSEAANIKALQTWLHEYAARETQRLAQKRDGDAALAGVLDRVACIQALASDQDSVAALLTKIDSLFSDDKGDLDFVLCSSVHKAKGMERDRVWLLVETFRRGQREEDNIFYVAITRSAGFLGLAR